MQLGKLVRFGTFVLCLCYWTLLAVYGASAQTTVNSDGVSVRNSSPGNVFFMFPVGESNVVEFQLGCSESSVNHNYLFIYEEQPDGTIYSSAFHLDIPCTFQWNSNYTAGSITLNSPITVTTFDHTITIDSATWTVVKATSQHGYYWKASGGSSTLTIN